jgi:hypothetical protein
MMREMLLHGVPLSVKVIAGKGATDAFDRLAIRAR